MPESAENYHSHDYRLAMRRRSVVVIAITGAVVAIWNLLFLLPPVLPHSFAEPLYRFFGPICHQIPERSIHAFGAPMAVCSRCFGIYFGLLVGVAIYPIWRGAQITEPISRVWLFLALVPIGIDWSLTFFGIWENTHLSRFVTGSILGAVCATYIVPAAIEIVWSFSKAQARTPSSFESGG